MERSFLDKVNYWLEEANVDKSVAEIFEANKDKIEIEESDKGVLAYAIMPDFKGGKSLIEIFLYLKREYRILTNVNTMMIRLEEIAKDKGCNSICIGSNYGYKDLKFIRFLERRGYRTDTLKKEI